MKQIKRSRLETKQELKVLFCSIYLGGDNCKKEEGGGMSLGRGARRFIKQECYDKGKQNRKGF